MAKKVPCPNGCGKTLNTLQEMREHLAGNCPKEKK